MPVLQQGRYQVRMRIVQMSAHTQIPGSEEQRRPGLARCGLGLSLAQEGTRGAKLSSHPSQGEPT